MNPVIYVDLKQRNPVARIVRAQNWYWIALNAGNGKQMARSKGYYTNQGDAYDAITQLFGNSTNVYLRQTEHGDLPIRLATAD
jgi:uncharacterized protein YegP (UPF0339 family)